MTEEKPRELVSRIDETLAAMSGMLNTLLDIGYLETPTMKERVTLEEMPAELFEINPSYASDLKVAMRR